MVAFSGGDKLDAKLKELSQKVNQSAVLRVGFLEGAAYPDGTSVAEVAAFNEFGVPSHGQPPRPFFRDMIAGESHHWGGDLGKLLKNSDYNVDTSLRLMGEEIRGELQDSINRLEEPPLAESTIKRKGFIKPLIDTSHMVNSVDFDIREK